MQFRAVYEYIPIVSEPLSASQSPIYCSHSLSTRSSLFWKPSRHNLQLSLNASCQDQFIVFLRPIVMVRFVMKSVAHNFYRRSAWSAKMTFKFRAHFFHVDSKVRDELFLPYEIYIRPFFGRPSPKVVRKCLYLIVKSSKNI